MLSMTCHLVVNYEFTPYILHEIIDNILLLLHALSILMT